MMGLDAAIGRIEQILQLQQQLFGTAASSSTGAVTGGAAIASGSAAGAGTSSAQPASSASSATSTNANFAAALASAQAASASDALTSDGLTSDGLTNDALASPSDTLADMQTDMVGGTDPLSSGLLDSLGQTALTAAQTAPAAATTGIGTGLPTAVDAMIDQANALVGKPYVWGGGHSGWAPTSGYDCSGFVSAVLHAGGYLSSPQDTQSLPSAAGIESGPGQYVTIYDRTDGGGAEDDHVIIDLGGQFYESGGESGSWGGGGGVERIATPTAAYLSTFNQMLHPAGL